jgi:hypothetical protein
MNKLRFAFLLLLLAATPASAINYLGATRQVTASAGAFISNTDQQTTSALGVWPGTASASYADVNGFASASVSQLSDIGDLGITMSGSLAAAASGLGYAGSALSHLSAEFTIDSNTPYNSIFLTSGGSTVPNFYFAALGGSPSYGANSSGVLPAGQYSLLVQIRADSPSSAGDYNYSLVVAPEPSSAVLLMVAGLLVATRRGKKF